MALQPPCESVGPIESLPHRPLFRVPLPPESSRMSEPSIARRQVEILNFLGLHLRPADQFVRLASSFQAEVVVHCRGGSFNGKSILDLTSLAAERGTILELEARGPDAEAALKALAELVAARFHEEEDEELGPSSPDPSAPPSGADPNVEGRAP